MNKIKRINKLILMIIIMLAILMCGSNVFAVTLDNIYQLMNNDNNFMTNSTLETLKGYLGSGLTNVDYAGGPYAYNRVNVLCFEKRSSSGVSGMGYPFVGIVDLNASGNSPMNIDLYYYDALNRVSYKDGKSDNTNTEAAKMAYEAAFVKKGKTSSWWQGHYYNNGRIAAIYNYLSSGKFGENVLYGFNYYLGNEDGKYSNNRNNDEIYDNQDKYADFVNQLGANASALVRSSNSNLQKIENGVKGIEFEKFIVDNGAYKTSQFQNSGTGYTLTVEATLEDGTSVSRDKITIFDKDGNQVNDLKSMIAGMQYRAEVNGASSENPVKNIKFKATYRLYQGRIAFIYGGSGYLQTRIIVNGKWVDHVNEVTFGEPEPGGDPGIEILKLSAEDNSPLQGAKFNIKLQLLDRTIDDAVSDEPTYEGSGDEPSEQVGASSDEFEVNNYAYVNRATIALGYTEWDRTADGKGYVDVDTSGNNYITLEAGAPIKISKVYKYQIVGNYYNGKQIIVSKSVLTPDKYPKKTEDVYPLKNYYSIGNLDFYTDLTTWTKITTVSIKRGDALLAYKASYPSQYSTTPYYLVKFQNTWGYVFGGNVQTTVPPSLQPRTPSPSPTPTPAQFSNGSTVYAFDNAEIYGAPIVGVSPTKIYMGDELKIVSYNYYQGSKWYNVKTTENGTTGYILEKYLTSSNWWEVKNVDRFVKSEGAPFYYNVRDYHDGTGNPDKTLTGGIKVQVIRKSTINIERAVWAFVKLNDGTKGFILANDLRETNTSATQAPGGTGSNPTPTPGGSGSNPTPTPGGSGSTPTPDGSGSTPTNIDTSKIFYIGDSWTVRWGMSGYLKNPIPAEYTHAAVGASASWSMFSDSKLKEVIKNDSSAIVVMLGLNNPTSSKEKMKDVITFLSENYPNKPIFIQKVCYVTTGYSGAASFNSEIDAYNREIEQHCAGKSNVYFIDSLEGLIENGYLKDSVADGSYHLKPNGCQILYDNTIANIQRIGGGNPSENPPENPPENTPEEPIEIDPNKIFYIGNGLLERINKNGSIDSNFTYVIDLDLAKLERKKDEIINKVKQAGAEAIVIAFELPEVDLDDDEAIDNYYDAINYILDEILPELDIYSIVISAPHIKEGNNVRDWNSFIDSYNYDLARKGNVEHKYDYFYEISDDDDLTTIPDLIRESIEEMANGSLNVVECTFRNQITDELGLIKLTMDKLATYGMDLSNYTGKLKLTITETEAPEGYNLIEGDIIVTLNIENGIITSIEGLSSDEKELDTDNNIARIKIFNDKGETSSLEFLEIVKVGPDGERLSGVNMSLNVDGFYKTDFVTDAEQEVDLRINFVEDIMDYDGSTRASGGDGFGSNMDKHIVENLLDIDKNNAAKFFDSDYLTEPAELTQKLRDDYLEEQVAKAIEDHIESTDTYKDWKNKLNERASGYNAFITAGRDYRNAHVDYKKALDEKVTAETQKAAAETEKSNAETARSQANSNLTTDKNNLSTNGRNLPEAIKEILESIVTISNNGNWDWGTAFEKLYEYNSNFNTIKQKILDKKADREDEFDDDDNETFDKWLDNLKDAYTHKTEYKTQDGIVTQKTEAINGFNTKISEQREKMNTARDKMVEKLNKMVDTKEDYFIYLVIKDIKMPNAKKGIREPEDTSKLSFPKAQPTDADMLKDWLWDRELDKKMEVLGDYYFGYNVDFDDTEIVEIRNGIVPDIYTDDELGIDYSRFDFTINPTVYERNTGNQVVEGEEFEKVQVKFEYSAWKFFYDSKCYESEGLYTVADLLRIYTGDIEVNLIETSTVDGYIKWEYGQMKTMIINYNNDGKKDENGNNHEGYIESIEYPEDTTDYTGFDHDERRDEELRYDILTVIAYNQTADPEVFKLDKYRVVDEENIPIEGIEFELNITVEHKNYKKDGIATKFSRDYNDRNNDLPTTVTFRKTTDENGEFTFTVEDYHALGIDVLSRWSGTLTFEISESTGYEGYIKWLMPRKFMIHYDDGKASIEIPDSEFGIEELEEDDENPTPTPSTEPTGSPTGNPNDEPGEDEVLDIRDVIYRGSGSTPTPGEEEPDDVDPIDSIIDYDEKDMFAGIIAWNEYHDVNQIIFEKKNRNGESLKGAEFDIKITRKDNTIYNGRSDTFENRRTTESGQIIIKTEELARFDPNDPTKGLGLDVINKWTGDLIIEIKETIAPDGYKLIEEIITVTVHYEDGKMTDIDSDNDYFIERKLDSEPFKDNDDYVGTVNIGSIIINNDTDARLRIRKVDAHTRFQDELGGEAVFSVTVTTEGEGKKKITKDKKETVDKDGYIDITDLVDGFATYTGTIEITLQEDNNPSGYKPIVDENGKPKELKVNLIYSNGKYVTHEFPKDDNPDDVSREILDVGPSEFNDSVTIAVKNTKEDNIFISKVDSLTGETLADVEFKVEISAIPDPEDEEKEEININKALNMNDVLSEFTSDDGVISIGNEALEKLGITDEFDGELYIDVIEISHKPGYKKAEDKISVKVRYDKGKINPDPDQTKVIKGDARVDAVNIEDDIILQISINNEKEWPRLVMNKKALDTDINFDIISAKLNVLVKAVVDGTTVDWFRTSWDTGNGELEIKKERIGDLFKENDSGILEIYVEEDYAGDQGLEIPEPITIKLEIENRRFKNVLEVSDDIHAAIVESETDGEKITIDILDTPTVENESIILEGKVWKERATTKGSGIVKDGIYTIVDDSDSEHSDKLFEGIEVTLYEVDEGGSLIFHEIKNGTNPTYTDAKGHYEFEVPEGKAYVVKFTYNGQAYEAVPYKGDNEEERAISSKASELRGEGTQLYTRDNITALLQKINQYPNNYTIPQEHELLLNGGNIAYSNSEIVDVIELIKDVTKEMLEEKNNNNIDTSRPENIRNIFNEVKARYTGEDIDNKLQYIYETRVAAYAGSATDENGIHWRDLSAIDTYTESNHEVNLALVERGATNLSLRSLILETKVMINDHETTYDMREVDTDYEQIFYQEDYRQKDSEMNYDGRLGEFANEVSIGTNGEAYYLDDKPMDFYITYQAEIENKTSILTQATKILAYYDTTIMKDAKIDPDATKVYIEKLDDQNNRTRVELDESIYQAEYSEEEFTGDVLENAENGERTTYKRLIIAFKDDEEAFRAMALGDKDKIIVEFAVKMENISKTLYDTIKELKDIWQMSNYAEIGGYQTKEGYLDVNSNPGTLDIEKFEKAKKLFLEAAKHRKESDEALEYYKQMETSLAEIRQDDAWVTVLKMRNNLNDDRDDFYHRTITGNVWEAAESFKDYQAIEGLAEYFETNKDMSGIIVELLEKKETDNSTGSETVVAKTVTAKDGSYKFSNYIAGDYTIRFIYGAKSREGYEDKEDIIAKAAETYNGEFYQSVEANPNTDAVTHWYAKYKVDDTNIVYKASTNENLEDSDEGFENTERYSDAYDEVTTRIAQIENQIPNTYTEEYDWSYEIDGIQELRESNHTDTIYAYTSTLNLEIEYTATNVLGSMWYEFYRYDVENVDFGLTPRAIADMDIKEYVSNLKIYLQSGVKQLDVDIDADGKIVKYNNDEIYQNIVNSTNNSTTYKDGLLEVILDETLLNGAKMEVTYTIDVTNNGEANTLKYFYDVDSINIEEINNAIKNGETNIVIPHPIGVAYYSENLSDMVYYESDVNSNGLIAHSNDGNNYKVKPVAMDFEIDVKTRATNIVDFVDPNLTFIQENQLLEKVNDKWMKTSADTFKSTREDNEEVMRTYTSFVRPTGEINTYYNYLHYLALCSKQNGTEDDYAISTGASELYTALRGGETISGNLVLSQNLETSSTGANTDLEYSNLIELIRLENYAGKVAEEEVYDITGEYELESSKLISTSNLPNLDEAIYEKVAFSTIGTGKSPTISIHAPTGSNMFDNIMSNMIVVLVALVILAGGIVLIKKFVVTPKND